MAEIKHYGDTLFGVVAQEDIVEGRMVLLTSNVFSRNFGSQTDLPGVKLPDTSAEAAKAFYCVLFEQDNRSLPLYQPHPTFGSWTLRQGWEQNANAPFDAKVFITKPGQQEGNTIPSGSGCVAFGDEAIMSVPSGAYIHSADLETPGATLVVANTADDSAADAGKLKYGTTNPVAKVHEYNSTTKRLVFRIVE